MMKPVFRSFYARLSVIFLLLIVLLGAGSIAIAFNLAGHLFDEAEQFFNSGYAKSIAMEIQPLVSEGFDENRIKAAIHYMMVLNPMVEIYLLDVNGVILTYFTHPGEMVVRRKIDPEPVREFIRSGGKRLILGDDPRSMRGSKPFSAAPLRMGTADGYVYIILGGESYERVFDTLRDSYYMRAGFITFLLALLTTLAAGLSLFFLLTRRITSLSQAAGAFKNGDFSYRLTVRGSDEISGLGRAFNEMAAEIEAGVEKLRMAERLRKELIANISHDLRSPLTSIRGYLETVIIKDTSLSPEKRKAYLEIVLRNVSGLKQLVEELFDLVMFETKQMQPRKETFRLGELAQDIVLKLRPEAERAGISLLLETDGKADTVDGDIGMIERLITNLIENALRFTPKGGSVRLALSGGQNGTEVSVIDTGSGIEPEDIPHVFERYFKAQKGPAAPPGGTGLGLAIARQIAGLHGSLLSVESESGKGTRFFFTLAPSRS